MTLKFNPGGAEMFRSTSGMTGLDDTGHAVAASCSFWNSAEMEGCIKDI
jgi:hypothetical protein